MGYPSENIRYFDPLTRSIEGRDEPLSWGGFLIYGKEGLRREEYFNEATVEFAQSLTGRNGLDSVITQEGIPAISLRINGERGFDQMTQTMKGFAEAMTSVLRWQDRSWRLGEALLLCLYEPDEANLTEEPALYRQFDLMPYMT